jgi:hypothetical protein
MKIEMKINGRRVTSASQIKRELKKAVGKAVENGLRRAAGPGVTIKKTSQGYVAEGTQNRIDNLVRRLK